MTGGDGRVASDRSPEERIAAERLRPSLLETVARAMFAALDAKDERALFCCLRDDAVWTLMLADPTGGVRLAGREAIVGTVLRGAAASFRGADPASSVASLVAGEGFVMAETVGTGVHLDGRHYRNVYAWALEFDGDRISRVREYMDTAYALSFLGKG